MVGLMKTFRISVVLLCASVVAVLPMTAPAGANANARGPIPGHWTFANVGTYATDMSGGFTVSSGATQYITNVSGTLVPRQVGTSCGTGNVALVGRFRLFPLGHDAYGVVPAGRYNLVKATVIHDGKRVPGNFDFTIVARRGGSNSAYTTAGDVYYDGRQCDVILFAKL
jgi:hypothetical protein